MSDTNILVRGLIKFIRSLLKHIQKHGDLTRPEPDATMVDILHNATVASYEKIVAYYQKTSHCYSVATELDPRLKLDLYSVEERPEIIEAVKNIFVRDYYPATPVSHYLTCKAPSIESHDSDDSDYIKVVHPTPQENELDSYLKNL
jgi:hypothetical protein